MQTDLSIYKVQSIEIEKIVEGTNNFWRQIVVTDKDNNRVLITLSSDDLENLLVDL